MRLLLAQLMLLLASANANSIQDAKNTESGPLLLNPEAVPFLALLGKVAASGNDTLCTNIPTGLNKLSLGVDITRLDLQPLDFTAPDGYMGPVVDFTCNQGKVWVDPYSGKTFQQPDQVWNIASVPGGWLDATISTYESSEEVKQSMAASAGVDILGGVFSASGSYKSFSDVIQNKSTFVKDVTSFVSSSQAQFAPSFVIGLTDYAKTYMTSLPSSFTDDPDAFMGFIRYFGTHYFSKGRFGGFLRMVFETDTSYYSSHTESEVSAQAKGSFFNMLKAKGGYDGSTFNVDTEFSKVTRVVTRYYGGNTNILSTDSLKIWQPTVASNPWIFGGDLEPITDLIPDSFGTKKDAMKTAVEVYLDKAFLNELSAEVTAGIQRYPEGNTNLLQPLLSQVNSQLVQVIPDHEAVAKLGQQIGFQLYPQAWWSKTALCYQFYADGDAGQCGGTASGKLCAPPNAYTSFYRDDTDGRGGGCQMSWGITAPNYADPWFDSTAICYRWHADGDGGQCGAGAPAESCAPVNKFTPYYRDDTDDRGGGCQMSWMLKVPDGAPTWLLNTKLCYHWYADGDGGQCGGGAPTLICATAGSWSQYYRDDTDGRGGGCQMQWALFN